VLPAPNGQDCSRWFAVPAGPFRANSGGDFPRVNPGLSYFGHFGPPGTVQLRSLGSPGKAFLTLVAR
jgi:hypothetical protein